MPGTVPFDCFRSVFRASWQEAAGGRQQGRYEQLIASHRSAQRHARHPYTIAPFHLITPARRPTNAAPGCRVARGSRICRDCDQVLPTHSVQGEPGPYGYPAPLTNGHTTIDEPRCLAGTTTKENRSGPPALQPRSARKSRRLGETIGCCSLGAAKARPIRSLISAEPEVALASEVVPLLSTLGRAPRGTILTRA